MSDVIGGGAETVIPGLIDNHGHLFMGAGSQDRMLDPGVSAVVGSGRQVFTRKWFGFRPGSDLRKANR